MSIWKLHGVFESGKEWGDAVSDLASTAPGAVAEHIRMMKDMD